MRGEFTPLACWCEVIAFSPLLSGSGGVAVEDAGDRSSDAVVTFRIGGPLLVIIGDSEEKAHRVVHMRWGTPDSRDWRQPRLIHGRAETIEAKEPFRTPFHAGQRGIVVGRTFSDGDEATPAGKTEIQLWTTNPREARPRGFAFVWRRFDVPGQPRPMQACVMVTVPANALIQRTLKAREKDPRMPAILEDDAWSTWLGEDNAPPPDAKAVLKTMNGVKW
jgi:putative SOS response-associated peptidase YedK